MIDTTYYSIQVRANARLLSAGRKTIEDIHEEDRVKVYVYAILHYEYSIDNVQEKYKEAVNKIINS